MRVYELANILCRLGLREIAYLDFACQLLRHPAHVFVPDNGFLPQAQEYRRDTLDSTFEC